MDAVTLFKTAYNQGVRIALEESLPEAIGAKEAGASIETPCAPIERPLHHDVKSGDPARFGAKGREYTHKRADVDWRNLAHAAGAGGLGGFGAATGAIGGTLAGAGVGHMLMGAPEEDEGTAKRLGRAALMLPPSMLGAFLGAHGGFSVGGLEQVLNNASKVADAEPDYVAKARDYADRYHKSLLARFKSEHEAKDKPPVPKV